MVKPGLSGFGVRDYGYYGNDGYALTVFIYLVGAIVPEYPVSPRRVLLNVGFKNLPIVTPCQQMMWMSLQGFGLEICF